MKENREIVMRSLIKVDAREVKSELAVCLRGYKDVGSTHVLQMRCSHVACRLEQAAIQGAEPAEGRRDHRFDLSLGLPICDISVF